MRPTAVALAVVFVVLRYGPDVSEALHLHALELPPHEAHAGTVHHHGDADDSHEDGDSDCHHHGHCCCAHLPVLAAAEAGEPHERRVADRSEAGPADLHVRADVVLILHVPIA